MFNNYINFQELYRIAKNVRRQYAKKLIQQILGKFYKSQDEKVSSYWSEHTEHGNIVSHWNEIPAVQKRINIMVSGKPEIDYIRYTSSQYLHPKGRPLRGLSLGCGAGRAEIEFVKENNFESFQAYDISEEAIKSACENGKDLSKTLTFESTNIYNLELKENTYDFIMVVQSLHHFSPLDSMLDKIYNSLKPDGIFLVEEFVGPTRFQWSEKQLKITNALLEIIPEEYKKLAGTSSIKPKIIRPSILNMLLIDPSEAIESAKIMPLLKQKFNIIESKGYGGTILHLLFSGIAHHFLSEDKDVVDLLNILFQFEDYFLNNKELESDFIFTICKKNESK